MMSHRPELLDCLSWHARLNEQRAQQIFIHAGGLAPTIDGGRQPTGVDEDLLGTLLVEPGVPAETVEQLRAMGHHVEVDGTGAPFGGYQAIMRLPDGVYVGATEMRKDGTVVAW